MEDQLDELQHSNEFDVLGLGDVLNELRSPKVRENIVADLRRLGEVESEVGISFVHWDWEGDNVHRGQGETESYWFFDYDQSFIGMSAFDIDGRRKLEEITAYATELEITAELAQKGKSAAQEIENLQYLFHVFHRNRSTADVQADK